VLAGLKPEPWPSDPEKRERRLSSRLDQPIVGGRWGLAGSVSKGIACPHRECQGHIRLRGEEGVPPVTSRMRFAWMAVMVLSTLVLWPATAAGEPSWPGVPGALVAQDSRVARSAGGAGTPVPAGTALTGPLSFSGGAATLGSPGTRAGPVMTRALPGSGLPFWLPQGHWEVAAGNHARSISITRWTGRDIPSFPGVSGPLRVFYLAGLLALAQVAMAGAPGRLQAVAGAMQAEPARCALWGLVAYAALIPVMVVSVITIIGIPVALGLLLALVVVRFVSFVGLSLYFGGLLTGGQSRSTALNPAWPLLAGSVAIGVVTSIPLVGDLISLGLSLVGTGAVLLSRFGNKHSDPIPPLPTGPSPHQGPGNFE